MSIRSGSIRLEKAKDTVTIGYPDFADEAKRNTQSAHVTLIRAAILGDVLVEFWQQKLTQDEILRLLKSQRYVEDPYQAKNWFD